MGFGGIVIPLAIEICLETPVRAAYEGIKRVEDYYSKFSEQIRNC